MKEFNQIIEEEKQDFKSHIKTSIMDSLDLKNTKFEVITLLFATNLMGRNRKGITALDEVIPLLEDKLQYSILLDYGNGTEYTLTGKEPLNG